MMDFLITGIFGMLGAANVGAIGLLFYCLIRGDM